MKKLANTLTVLATLALLVTYSVLIEKYEIFKINAIIGGIIIIVWAFSRSGFAYPTEYISYSDWLLGHKLKHSWAVFLGIVTAFCFPMGLGLRLLYYSFLFRKDGTFSQKFYFFFEAEESTL